MLDLHNQAGHARQRDHPLGAIMLASNATGNNRSIINGTLTALQRHERHRAAELGRGRRRPRRSCRSAPSSANNGTNDNPVTIVGDGTTVLTGANTFRGSVYLSGGTLEVASAAPLGADSVNPAVIKNLFLDGGTLHTTGDFTWTNRNIVVYGDRSTIQIDAGKTFLHGRQRDRRRHQLPVARGHQRQQHRLRLGQFEPSRAARTTSSRATSSSPAARAAPPRAARSCKSATTWRTRSPARCSSPATAAWPSRGTTSGSSATTSRGWTGPPSRAARPSSCARR